MLRAFTIIELLVVITIIVLLLALLTPALDQALYQAELALCGSRHHAAATGFQTYAFDHQRSYPNRPLATTGPAEQIYAHVKVGDTHTWQVDDRPQIKDYVAINKMLNDPLVQDIEMEDAPISTDQIYAPVTMWAGFRYVDEKGMLKMGDRMEYNGETFNLLIGDSILREDGWGRGSHPDKAGVWAEQTLQDASNPWVGNGMTGDVYSTVTYSFWIGGERGTLDVNYAFQDGSVRRYDDVTWEDDPRFAWIMNYSDKATIPPRLLQVPTAE